MGLVGVACELATLANNYAIVESTVVVGYMMAAGVQYSLGICALQRPSLTIPTVRLGLLFTKYLQN